MSLPSTLLRLLITHSVKLRTFSSAKLAGKVRWDPSQLLAAELDLVSR